MGRELEVNMTGSQIVILRARWMPRRWGGGTGRGRRIGKKAVPKRGKCERCHIVPPHPHPITASSVAMPKLWLMWSSTRELGERQP